MAEEKQKPAKKKPAQPSPTGKAKAAPAEQQPADSGAPARLKELYKKEVAPALWKVSKCPDLVEDRGHYFGTELPDADKLALIEFLKTL